MGRSPGFGSITPDLAPSSDSLSLRLRLPGLTLPGVITRRLILQEARSQEAPPFLFSPHSGPVGGLLGSPTSWVRKGNEGSEPPSYCPVGLRFQALFHSPSGVLFTFPSRYLCAIGQRVVFSLGGWSPRIRAGFLVSDTTQGPSPGRPLGFRLRGYHPLWLAFPGRFGYPGVF